MSADVDFQVSIITKELLGTTIVGAITDPEEEFFGLKLESPSGHKTLVWILRDDEGNGCGSLDVQPG